MPGVVAGPVIGGFAASPREARGAGPVVVHEPAKTRSRVAAPGYMSSARDAYVRQRSWPSVGELCDGCTRGADVSGLVHGAAGRRAGGVIPTIEDGGARPARRPIAPAISAAAEGSLRSHANHTFIHLHPAGPAGSGGSAGSGRPAGSGVLARFVHAAARSAARRPKTTVALWLALIVACVVLGSSAGMRTLSNSGSGTGESARADARLTASGLKGPATENVLVRSSSPQRTAHAVAALEAGARRLPAVKSVDGPDRSPELSRAGGRTALVVVTLRGDPDNPDSRAATVQHFVDGLSARQPGVTFNEAGSGSEDNAITQLVNNGLHRAELISVPITLLILVLAFGALVAASVPLLLGLTSVGAALGALGLVSHIAPNGSSTAPVVVLIGLAVGVDYSLFYIRRERAERRPGRPPTRRSPPPRRPSAARSWSPA